MRMIFKLAIVHEIVRQETFGVHVPLSGCSFPVGTRLFECRKGKFEASSEGFYLSTSVRLITTGMFVTGKHLIIISSCWVYCL